MKPKEVFSEPVKSDVLIIDSSSNMSEILAYAAQAKMTIYTFDGMKFANQRELMDHFPTVMNSPYTVNNWDWLQELLETTEWLENEKGELIVYTNIEHFHSANRSEFDMLLDIFTYVTKFRNKRPQLKPLVILLHSTKNLDLPFRLPSIIFVRKCLAP